ncbi:TFPI [Mytilus edulis]|uniref:TFPI n=1 Tax=Mytilus edulis TaxID=6550 RepID=A0A8S3SGK6_MYTED|nr:TFPI [Mytilus edulis]
MKTVFIAICIFCMTLVTLVYGSTIPAPTEFTGNSDCLLHTIPGDCLGFFPRYSYRSGMCKTFIYGGCGGNANNFLDIEECQKAYYKMKTLFIAICIFCVTLITVVHGSTIPAPTEFTGNNDCLLPTRPGHCPGHFPRYSYRSGMCKVFIYGGCDGNANNYLNIDECKIACMSAS